MLTVLDSSCVEKVVSVLTASGDSPLTRSALAEQLGVDATVAAAIVTIMQAQDLLGGFVSVRGRAGGLVRAEVAEARTNARAEKVATVSDKPRRKRRSKKGSRKSRKARNVAEEIVSEETTTPAAAEEAVG